MPQRAVLALSGAALALILLAAPHHATIRERAEFVGVYLWSRDEPVFGGFSGLELDEDGLGFVAVTDSAALYRGRFRRNAAGAVTGVTTDGPRPVPGPDGGRLGHRETDAEGLALAADGRLYISFEGTDRIGYLSGDADMLHLLPRAEAFRQLRLNRGLESVAIDPQGRIVTLPEESGARDRPFPVWRWDGRGWEEAFTLPRDGDFVPTDADFGPDGALYLLERRFRYLLGFRSRISRFAIGPDGPGPREVLMETHGPVFDNLEALSVWTDSDGLIRLTLMSDDNFNPVQRTEIVDFRLPRER